MDWIKLKAWIEHNKLTIVLVAIIVGLLLMYYSTSFDQPMAKADDENDQVAEQNQGTEAAEESAETEPAGKIIVHISGEVANPGIIELDYGQRLYEAIEMAGGTTAKADVDQVNLAMILEDQQKVVIPSTDQVLSNGSASQSPQTGDKVNINTADKTELMELPRVGEVTADAIIQYREENNGFKKIEDIKNVPRIGDVTFDGFKDSITCY